MNLTLVTNSVDFNKRILNFIKGLPAEIERATREEAKIVLTDAVELCPWETRALQNSGRLGDTEYDGHKVTVPIIFGEGLNYAIYVHEHTWVNHPRGGQAKFLETAVNDNEPGFVGRVGINIKLERIPL